MENFCSNQKKQIQQLEQKVELEIEKSHRIVENFKLLVQLCLEKLKLAHFINDMPEIASSIEKIETNNDWSLLIEIFEQLVNLYPSLKRKQKILNKNVKNV